MLDIKKLLKDDKFIITCDSLFGALRLRNIELLDLSNKTYDVSFNDAIDFSITSNALSIIKGYFYNTIHSYTTILLMRNIIEDFALKEMFVRGNLPKESIELLKYNGFIEDYKQYKDLKGDEYNKIIDYEKMLEDYQGALTIYNKYGVKEKDVLKMNIPFILKKKTSYQDIIEENLSDFTGFYKILSFYIHPHNYSMEGSEEKVDLAFINIIYKLLEYYIEYITKINKNNTFSMEKNILLSFMLDLPDNYPLIFINHCVDENKLIVKLGGLIEKAFGKNNYLKHLLDVLPNMIYDICTDSVHGQTENCKMKFKTILELFAVYDWLFFNENYDENHFKLLNYYSAIKENDAYDYHCEENYKEAFKIFKKLYPNANDYNQFKKTFGMTLGFTIDEYYCKMTLNEMINRYIDKNYKDVKAIDGISIITMFKVLYSEACSMGHGKAYSFFSNTGAFSEDINVISITDYMLINFLIKYKRQLRIYDIDGEYKNIFDEIDSLCESIKNIMNEKIKIMKLKNINFDFKTLKFTNEQFI